MILIATVCPSRMDRTRNPFRLRYQQVLDTLWSQDRLAIHVMAFKR